ncbi:MAG: DUF505 domain-containing protein [Chlorobi bacterium]|nr:DUF505 domain-containing protein [Chlorobiota bacterium]
MVIRKEHALALRRLWELSQANQLAGISEIPEEVREELDFAGLITYPDPLHIKLTYFGLQLAELLEKLYEIKEESITEQVSEKEEHEYRGVSVPEEWEEKWRWIGSEIIALLDSAHRADQVGPEGRDVLMERGLARIVRDKASKKEKWQLTEIGEEILKIYNSITPRIEINNELADLIRKVPVGPAPSSQLPTGSHEEHLLENMRLIAYSVPQSDIFAFTALGQAIKKALATGGFGLGVVLSEDLMISLWELIDGKEVPEEAVITLMELGYINDSKEPLPAGEWLLEAYRLWKEGAREEVWTFSIEEEEVAVLKTIAELWNKYEDNPRDNIPTFDHLRREMIDKKVKEYKQLVERYGRRLKEMPDKYREIASKFIEAKDMAKWYDENFDLWAVLYSLESFELIKTEVNEEGKEVFNLTEIGRMVLNDQERNTRDISSTGVKAITMCRKTFSAPNKEWFDVAVEENLIGTSEPTQSGLMYAHLAETITRTPFLTKYGMMIFKAIPDKGVTVNEIYEMFEKELGREKVRWVLEKLEARHLIEILPDGNIVETEAGRKMDMALSGVPTSIGFPLNPLIVRLLKALKEVGTLYVKEHKVRILPRNIEKAIRLSGLSPETFKKMFKVAELAGWVGKSSVTSAGLWLLEAVDLMQPKEELIGLVHETFSEEQVKATA